METYKITKTIRFKLEADEENSIHIKEDIINIETNDNEFTMVDFVSNLGNYIKDLKNYLFYEKKDGSLSFKDKIIIKNEWLRQYAKQDFVELKSKKRINLRNNRMEQIKIGDIPRLSSKIEETLDIAKEIYSKLSDDATLEQHERTKKAQIGLLLKRLEAKNVLPLLMDLVKETLDKDETDDLSIRLKRQSQKINSQLKIAIRSFLPEQSNGLQIAKASFNYYTINKKPIDFEKKIEDLKKNLNVKDLEKLNVYFDKKEKKQKNYLGKKIFSLFETDIQKALSKNQPLYLGDAPMIDSAYVSLRQIFKKIKSEQKKQFSELMQNKCSYDELKNSNLYLLNDIGLEQFNTYREKTKELEELATKLSNQNLLENAKERLRSQKEKIAKERGNIMKDRFQTWKSFANFYRTVSQKHGKILAQLKGIEKEQAESQLLKYWALICEKENQHQLWLIPREKAWECKRWLETVNDTSIDNENSIKLYWFESLTYRSLQKLCFGFLENGNNEFNQNIKDLLPKDRIGNTINGEFAFEGDEERKIEFYKTVLNSKYAKQVLNIPFKQVEEEIISQSFENLSDFQIALEKICYRRFAIYSNYIISFDAQIFDITSLDLKNNEKNNLNTHTHIWRDFWKDENEKNNFDIRLNPEITISYRTPKQSRIEKYGEKTKEYDPNKNNRYLHPQFTLITTISERSNSQTKTLSFIEDEDFKKSINEFNKKLKKDNIKFAFGIDNGEVELSTLGVYLPTFEKETHEEKIYELKQIKKYGFEVLTITDLKYKETDYNGNVRKIIQNPSYFLKKENYIRTFSKSEQEYEEMFAKLFKKEHVLSLDLTTAKMICGHIVTNGDVPALFNLWLKHAQRNVFEMNDHTVKETAKTIRLRNNEELTDNEKEKFAEFISDGKKFAKLTKEGKKSRYLKWIFEDRKENSFTEDENKKFNDCQKKKGKYNSHIIFASRFEGDELKSVTPIFDCRHVFKKRKEFETIRPIKEIENEISRFNTNRTSHNISNEELDLKITDAKKALVANAIGVIDFLYKQYKQRFNDEGLIIKEGFDTQKVEEDIEKFSGNIYRILERKLYQKFQNYGLVPPIKNLMAVRNEGIKDKNAILRLGNIAFIDPSGTSQECPVCKEKSKEKHTNNFICECGFNSTNIMHSNDGIAGFNIAKRGFENFINEK